MFCMRTAGNRRIASARRLFILVLLSFAASLTSNSGVARADFRPFWEKSETQKVSKQTYSAKKAGYQKRSYQKGAYKKSKYARTYKTKTGKRYGSKTYANGKHRSKRYAARRLSKTYAGSRKKKLGGFAATTESKKRRKGYEVAALGGGTFGSFEKKKSLSDGSVRWVASSGCLDGRLKSIIYSVAASYGRVTVNSTCRSKGHNRRVGGAPRSKHLSGDAVDFRVHDNVRGVYAFLRNSGSVGGLKHYGGGLFHIDTGPRRTW